ncbi:Fic family protein [Candidatus Woesearchaeota archaeon]|nr:Fic family protein [Candidatus Woesearchaeota archaeon]
MSKGEITSRDEKGFNKNTFFYYVRKLKEQHLLLIVDRKPISAVVYQNHLLEKVLEYYGFPSIAREKTPSLHVYTKIERLLKNDSEREIEFLHSSLFMEGTTLTLGDTKNLFIRKIAPQKPVVDIRNMENYKAATDHVRTLFARDLSEETIVKLQAISMRDAEVALGIRTKDVHISGNPNFKICKLKNIRAELQKFVNYFNAKLREKQTIKEMIATSAYVHNQFQYIHPFYDGNSRTTRLLWQYFLLHKKLPIINIYAAQKEKYMSLTKMYKKRDDKKLAEFFAFIILDNLQAVR